MSEQKQCKCAWDLISLNYRNKYNEKTIRRALNKTTTVWQTISTDTAQLDTIIKATNALITHYKDNQIPIQFEHDCEQAKAIIELVLKASNNINQSLASNNAQPDNKYEYTTDSGEEDLSTKDIELITRHFYRNGRLKFRCALRGYDISMTEEPHQVMRSPEATATYLRKLNSKALMTILTRAPYLAKLLKKDIKDKTAE